MEQLKKILNSPDVRGVLRSSTGDIVKFHNPGVKDLYNLVVTRPVVLKGACVADRVIGRGAALLMVKGCVAEVFAEVVSEPALDVLRHAGIATSYNTLVPNIINRNGTDMCPVEKLTMTVSNPDVALEKIKEFLINNNII